MRGRCGRFRDFRSHACSNPAHAAGICHKGNHHVRFMRGNHADSMHIAIADWLLDVAGLKLFFKAVSVEVACNRLHAVLFTWQHRQRCCAGRTGGP